MHISEGIATVICLAFLRQVMKRKFMSIGMGIRMGVIPINIHKYKNF